jgi:very-short-patch-repair endonuclease
MKSTQLEIQADKLLRRHASKRRLKKAEKRHRKKKEELKGMALLHSRNMIYRKRLLNKPTKAELIVRKWLKKRMHSNPKFQKGFLKPFHRIVDFYIPKHKIIIEVDGGYHINTKEKDRIKDKRWLEERGCVTIRITNEDVFNGTYKKILTNFLEGRGVQLK